MSMQILQPVNWPAPKGYSNGIIANQRLVFIAGQVGWDESGKLQSDDLVEQAGQALMNIKTILAEAGGKPEHIVRLTWYITDGEDYLTSRKQLGRVYRNVLGSHYPAMTLLIVKGLIEEGAKVEIEATAVLPDRQTGQ